MSDSGAPAAPAGPSGDAGESVTQGDFTPAQVAKINSWLAADGRLPIEKPADAAPTLEQSKAALAAAMRDQEFVAKYLKGDAAAVQKMSELQRAVAPGEEAFDGAAPAGPSKPLPLEFAPDASVEFMAQSHAIANEL